MKKILIPFLFFVLGVVVACAVLYFCFGMSIVLWQPQIL